MGLLRLIASTKTTVFLLVLLALTALFAAFGKALPIAKTLLLDQGLSSIPFLVLLDLLLLNQIGAAIVRFRQHRKRRKDPFYEHQSPADELDEIDDDWGVVKPQKKKGEPLPFPAPVSARSGKIDTLLPADNAEAMLSTLSFRLHRPEGNEDDSAEAIVGRKGPSTAWYTFALHAGAIALLAGFILLLAVMPGEQTTLYKGTPHTLKVGQATPFSKMMTKLGMTSQKTATMPNLSVALDKVTPKNFEPFTFLHISQRKLSNWEQSVDALFLNPKKLPVRDSNLLYPTSYEATLQIGTKGSTRGYQISLGERETHKGYQFSVSSPRTMAVLKNNGKAHNVDQNKTVIVAGIQLRVYGVARPKPVVVKGKAKKAAADTPKAAPAKLCTLISITPPGTAKPTKAAKPAKPGKKSAKAPKALKKSENGRYFLCVAVGATFKVGSQTFALTESKLGVKVQYQRAEAYAVLWLGLALFLLGFIGFWWPTRYELQLLWRRGNNDITIRGNGIGAAPKEMLDGIAKTLYFPPEWLGGPAKSPARPAPPSAPPVPTPPQSLRQGNQGQQAPAVQRQPARPTQTKQREPLPPTPAPPQTRAPQAVPPAPPAPAAPKPPAPVRQAAPVARKASPKTETSPPPAPVSSNAANLTFPPPAQSQPQQRPSQTTPGMVRPDGSILPPGATPAAPRKPVRQTVATGSQPVPTPVKRTQTSDSLPAVGSKTSSSTAGRVAVRPTSKLRQTDSFDQTQVAKALESVPQAQAPASNPPRPSPKSYPPKPANIKLTPTTSKETGAQPTIETVKPELLLPTEKKPVPTKKDEGLDLDSLFQGLETNKPTKTDEPADLALDIDALFNDFEGKLTTPKKG